MTARSAPVLYDGISSFPARDVAARPTSQRVIQIAVTAAIVLGPFAGLVAAVVLLWGQGVGFADLGLARDRRPGPVRCRQP